MQQALDHVEEGQACSGYPGEAALVGNKWLWWADQAYVPQKPRATKKTVLRLDCAEPTADLKECC